MKALPQRMCVGCREMKNKRELIRIVRDPQGLLSVDLKGKMPGRGAYICPNEACFKKAVKGRSVEKALNVKIKEELWEEVKAKLLSKEE